MLYEITIKGMKHLQLSKSSYLEEVCTARRKKNQLFQVNFFSQGQFLSVPLDRSFYDQTVKTKLLETGRFAWWATASGATDEYRATRVIIFFENLKTTELANSTLKQQFKKNNQLQEAVILLPR